MKKHRAVVFFLIFALALSACSPTEDTEAASEGPVVEDAEEVVEKEPVAPDPDPEVEEEVEVEEEPAPEPEEVEENDTDDHPLADVAASICQALKAYEPESRFGSYERQVAAQVREGHEDSAVRNAVKQHCGELIAEIEAAEAEKESEEVVEEETEEELPPIGVDIVKGSGVPEEIPGIVEEELTRAAAFIEGLTGYRTDDFTVFLFSNKEELLDRWMSFHDIPSNRRSQEAKKWANYSGWGGDGYIFLLFGERLHPSKNFALYHIVAHEYVHVIQYAFEPYEHRGGDTSVPPLGPIWLSEGVAEYLTIAYMAKHRNAEPLDMWVSNAKTIARNSDITLRSIETRSGVASTGIDKSYVTGAVAVHILAEEAGIPAIMKYYERVKETNDWKLAFKQAFGLTIEEFYEKFEKEYR